MPALDSAKWGRTWSLTNRRGRPLTSQAIGMLLRNQIYAGIVDAPEYGVRDKRGDFELISADLFYRVQSIPVRLRDEDCAAPASAPGFHSARVRPLRVLWTEF